jgi:hypothetical protein
MTLTKLSITFLILIAAMLLIDGMPRHIAAQSAAEDSTQAKIERCVLFDPFCLLFYFARQCPLLRK